MQYEGICQKMHASIQDSVPTHDGQLAVEVKYQLMLNQVVCPLSDYIGQRVTLQWTGDIHCIACALPIKKSYAQGHCFRCMQKLASCDMCMMKPETCHFHLGTCRDEGFAKRVCFQPHIVYLANSSGPKIGITRYTQMPTRWLDQGATQALPIFQTESRRLAGQIEVEFAKFMADKTDWRALLRGTAPEIQLNQLRDQLFLQHADFLNELNPLEHGQFTRLTDENTMRFDYPVLSYPKKINSFNLDNNPTIEGLLKGIKGQYLIFEQGVINLRKYTGYHIIINVDSSYH